MVAVGVQFVPRTIVSAFSTYLDINISCQKVFKLVFDFEKPWTISLIQGHDLDYKAYAALNVRLVDTWAWELKINIRRTTRS